MSDKDYGYFGKGSTGYAQYKTSFDRNFDGPDKQPQRLLWMWFFGSIWCL